MTEELKLDLMKKFKELNVAEYTTKYGDYYGLMFAGAEIATKELKEENKGLKLKIYRLESDCDAYNYSQRTYQEEIKDLKELYKKADENWWNAQQTIKELQEQIEKMQDKLKSDLIARLKENMSYSTSPSCTKGMELFIKSIEEWEIKEK